MSTSRESKGEKHQAIISSEVEVHTSKKVKRTDLQKLECLRKAISNSKEHIKAGDPTRIHSQYIRYALDEFVSLNKCFSTKAVDLNRRDVIYEHVVPHSVVMKKLLELDSLTDENIMSVLKKFYVICVITKEEDKRLSAAGLRRDMPHQWNHENDSIFARYEHEKVQISIHKKPTAAD